MDNETPGEENIFAASFQEAYIHIHIDKGLERSRVKARKHNAPAVTTTTTIRTI